MRNDDLALLFPILATPLPALGCSIVFRRAQILVQHIKALLPELKARINAQMVTLQKELASYGEAVEKVPLSCPLPAPVSCGPPFGRRALLLSSSAVSLCPVYRIEYCCCPPEYRQRENVSLM